MPDGISSQAQVALGLPLYNAPEHLPEALESLLVQTYPHFRLVMVDDSTDAGVAAIAKHYAKRDPRLSYERNPQRLGLTLNWHRAFDLAARTAPEAGYFAWVSDHDVWHPRWLESLVREAARRPDAGCIYPRAAVLGDDRELRPRPSVLDTTEIAGRDELISTLARGMRAGYVVYGLLRVEDVRAAGGFRHVIYADRLLLTEVALRGALVEHPDVLWYKRPTGTFSVARQRAACFPSGVPLSARLPWWIVHGYVLARELGVLGRGRPAISASAGFGIALRYARANGTVALRRRFSRRRKAEPRVPVRKRLSAVLRIRGRLRRVGSG